MLNNPFVVAATATAAVSVAALFIANVDCNPTLYLYDRLVVTEKRLQDHFHGKRIWITGASSGLGAELAKQLASMGVELILSGRSVHKLEIVASECRTLRCRQERKQDNNNQQQQQEDEFTKIMTLPLDMACSQEEMEQAVDRVLLNNENNKHKDLDCVVLNAGIGHQSPALETDRTTTEQMMTVNALGPIHMTQTILKKNYKNWISSHHADNSGARPSRRGHFVITSSVGGKFALPLSASYAASKHALHGYFNSLRSEYPSLCIDIICPGPIATPFFQQQEGEKPAYQKNSSTTQQSENNNNNNNKKKELKMTPERCARLMMSSMMFQQKRKNTGKELWIAKQPTLFFCYLSQYLPTLATLIVNRIGPLRVAIWEAGLDLYDPESFRKVAKLKQERNAQEASSLKTMSMSPSGVANKINSENVAEQQELKKTK